MADGKNVETGAQSGQPASSVGAYYPWLDALRGISWILVMIGHTTEFGYIARMGVGIFFAISGWLITKIILGSIDGKWSLLTFYTRRAIRIIPLYYVLIVVASAAGLLYPGWKANFPWFAPQGPEYKLLDYLVTFAAEEWRGFPGGLLISHTWSLGVEERFYVFWPILLTLWPSVGASRRVLIVGLIGLYWAVVRTLPEAPQWTAHWAMPFPLLFGCALAIFKPFPLQSVSRAITLPVGAAAFVAYVALSAWAEPRVGPTIGTFGIEAGVLSFVLTAAAVATRGDSRNLVFRGLQEAGKISYAAYLFHPIFAFIAIKTSRAIGLPYLGPFLGVAMIGPIAWLIHRYIETPFLNLRPRLERSRRTRIALSVLQTGPILVGLVFLFPWRDLLAQFDTYPPLRTVAAVAGLGVLCAVAVRARVRLAVAALEGLAAATAAVHGLLRRGRWVLVGVFVLALVAMAVVAVTGGFRWSVGSAVLLSVRRLDRPFLVFQIVAVLLLIATMAPASATPPPALEEARGESR